MRSEKGLNLHRSSVMLSRFAMNPDKHVFNMVLVLNLTFMLLYMTGCSVPAWNVVEERVQDFQNCSTADVYLGSGVRQSFGKENTRVMLMSSLWYMKLEMTNENNQYSTFLPFAFIQQNKIPDSVQRGMVVEHVFPKCLTTLLICAFLGLGIVFMCCSSTRPSRLIYYGLTSLMILAALTMWITTAMTNSEKQVLSATFDLCIQKGTLKTSVLLQMITGSFGLVAFTLACMLIHTAVIISSHIYAQHQTCDEEDNFDLMEKVSEIYTKPDYLCNKIRHV